MDKKRESKLHKESASSESHDFHESSSRQWRGEQRHSNVFNDMEERILPENELFLDVLGEDILLVIQGTQLNLFGQTFRPIFCGTVAEVTNGFITLDPVIIKMANAPFHRFPTPLSFPIEKISNFTPFDCSKQIPLI